MTAPAPSKALQNQQTVPTTETPAVRPFQQQLMTYLKAGYPLLYLVTPEEDRAIEQVTAAVSQGDLAKRKVFVWSVSRGLCTSDMKVVDRKTSDPKRILPFLEEFAEPGVFILEDFHFYMDERSPTAPLVIRQLRDLIAPFKSSRKTIVLLSSVLKLPLELEKDLTVIDLEMPDEADLLGVLNDTIDQVKDNPRVEINLPEGGRENIVKSLLGLTRSEAENALAKLVVTRSRLDPQDVDLLLSEKEQIIRKSGMLEFYSAPERFGSIGGLDNLKQWLRERREAFSEKARKFGLPNPRGLLLVGVPGCGKSLSAKAVSAEWQMPLLKFDLGKVFGGLVGQSEENMRRSLKMAESVAPCVLWVDEIEKGLAGSRGGSGDSGVTTRVFGTLLTWMEENQKQVFTIATANDIDGLPPELLRKGRFDEVFFIDLPTPQERLNILAIQLTRHHRDYHDFELVSHVEATEGFSGAELEQVVVSSLYAAFAEGDQTRVTDAHLRSGTASIVPLSQSMGDKITRLRSQAAKWRPASAPVTSANQATISEPVPVARKAKRVFDV